LYFIKVIVTSFSTKSERERKRERERERETDRQTPRKERNCGYVPIDVKNK